MVRPLIPLTVAAVVLGWCLPVRAGDDDLREDKAEQSELPAPRIVMPPYSGPWRISRYEVWQFYAVDRHGYFRPRVIYAPSGPYYLYNGAPYYYAPVRQLDFMPYVTD
jgi:hypothetical protein